MNRAWNLVLAATIAAVLGCGSPPPAETDTASAPAPPAPAPPGPAVDDSAEASEPAAEEPAAEMPSDAPLADAGAPADAASGEAMPAEGTTEEAQAGVGAKGRDYGGPGFVTTPVETYFRTGERIAFEIQIPNAMKLYKANHNNKGPQTHEEFMEVIVRENGVDLPELPEGDEFVYDPETEKLMVRHPVQ